MRGTKGPEGIAKNKPKGCGARKQEGDLSFQGKEKRKRKE